jgi:hypothetical protein
LERQEIYIQDRRGAISKAVRLGTEKGREEGREEGRKEGELALTMRFLERRVGALPSELQSQIRRLPIALLENLADALLNFNDISDLTAWLQTNDFDSN